MKEERIIQLVFTFQAVKYYEDSLTQNGVL